MAEQIKTRVLPSCLPLPLEDAKLVDIVSKAKDYAQMHGICMRPKVGFNPDALQFAPFVLTPSLYPRSEFEKATNLQTVLNELIHNVAHDFEFLRSTLASTIKVDTFTAGLFDIFEKILAEGLTQNLSLGLLRSDYFNTTQNKILQVEFNTIASSFGGISGKFRAFHSYILQELGHGDKVGHLPENKALSGLCDAMVESWKIVGNEKAVILFIIEDVTYNICDQRFHEFYIRENYKNIRVIRKTLTEIFKEGRLGANKELIVGDDVASVVYFRAGYEPNHYPTDNEWDARLLIERSAAIKCPSIHYHLAGTKKVQQALAMPGVLNRFLKDEDQIKRVKDIFTGLYSLDKDEGGEEAVKKALEDPESYVMKPQREGGGNNIYGSDIPGALSKMTDVERSAYILMERIFPPISRSYMLRPNAPSPPQIVDMVSELGIFGAIIGSKDKILYNKQVGHMLRTKISSANEGGVAAGLGALDSVFLVDDF